jgi:hypothetical protein
MKKKMLTSAALLLFIVVCFAAVADLTGTWVGKVKLPEADAGSNDFSLRYVFKVDSGKLTGTAHMPQGEVNITDGMINGNEFSFNVPVPNGNAPHTGKFYGDSIALHIVYKGEHLQTTLKRE